MLAAWIRELATAFPPHAVHAVAESLATWSRWAGGSPDPDEATRRQLSAQGLLWRSLLSGEKHATDMLEPIDRRRLLARQVGCRCRAAALGRRARRVIYERITPRQIIAKAGPGPERPDDPSLVAAAGGP
jgi:hypothetical protein